MDGSDKRRQRAWKRLLKREGSQRRRRRWKRDLQTNPEEARDSIDDLGPYRSAPLNGLDRDATRRRDTDRESGNRLGSQSPAPA
jgi:hypothetical protein